MIVWLIPMGALLIIALTALLNTITFPRLGKRQKDTYSKPRVSVLIPARNEVERIGTTLRLLLAQDYDNYEIHVLDDQSTDGTREAALAAAAGDLRLHIHQGTPLPPGWLGKNWACQQLAQAAEGELLVFTDADVQWAPGALSAVVAQMEATRTDAFTVWPTQETITWAERLVVPMMQFVILGYLPEVAVRFLPWSIFAAANGQCLAFRREAYTQIGGHAAVRGTIVEDVGLAQAVKRHRLRIVMALGDRLVQTRMYAGWPSARDGFAKSILAGHANSPAFLVFSGFFHWTLFAVPWVWLGLGWFFPVPTYPVIPLALVGLGLGIRLLAAAATHDRLRDAFLLPVSVGLFTLIAWRALHWHFTQGGPSWKGRTIPGSKQ